MSNDILSGVQDKIGNLPQMLYDAIKKPFVVIYDKLKEIFGEYENYIYTFLIVIGVMFVLKIIMNLTTLYSFFFRGATVPVK